MTSGLFYAHSGLRYLILLLGLIAAVYFALAIARGRPPARADRTLMSTYVGLLDLQLLIGVALVATGIFYPALSGHLLTMIAAIALAHATSVLARKPGDPSRSHKLRLAGVAGSLLLILAGIAAIGRGIFSSGAPSM